LLLLLMRNEGDLLLWRSFKKGDWDAYSRLYDSYFGLLNNYGYKFTREAELIEDAVHDLFVRLWTSRERLSDPLSVKNYLFKSLRNILLRKMKWE
jgi:RNA polymerase sigma factor (sigma-70 family)